MPCDRKQWWERELTPAFTSHREKGDTYTWISPSDTPLADHMKLKNHGLHHKIPRGCPYKIGDLVVLKRGWTAKRVEGFTATGSMATSYGPESPPENWEVRTWRDFEAVEGQPKNRIKKNSFGWPNKEIGKEIEMEKLYTWKTEKGKDLFGTKLSAMKDGTWVMELKGGAGVATVDPKNVERVMPYTVALSFNDSSKVYNYFAKEGSVENGDVVMVSRPGGGFGIAIVTKVDSKSERADTWLTGTVLTAKAVLEGDDEE